MSRPSAPLTPAPELLDLHGRTALVTGGGAGIGRAISRRLHAAGARVVIADIDTDGEGVAAELDATRPATAVFAATDVTRDDEPARAVATAIDRFGRLDILVNNAGVYPSIPLAELTAPDLRRILDVNLVGMVLCTQAASEQMVAQGRGGRVVNITSIAALHPARAGLAHYAASKHGAWGFTKSAALELAPHGILVNAIAPGGVAAVDAGAADSDPAAAAAFASSVPLGRRADPDDIARAALFLASDLSSYVTGAQLVVDGGALLR